MSRKPVHAAVWRIEFDVPEGMEGMFAEFISDASDSMTMMKDEAAGLWRFTSIFQDRPDVRAFISDLSVISAACRITPPQIKTEEIPGTDWVMENLQSFPPMQAGRFFVHGSHWAESPPVGSIALKVDAGAAFGSGEHATTRACLMAIDHLARHELRPERTLDLGCGTAILGMAVAKRHLRPVVASDIDPVAVDVARENAWQNGVGPLLTCLATDGLKHPTIRETAPYDLVVANILARPLIRLAGDIVASLAPGGNLVLSGLLNHQEQRVLAAYRPRGLRLVRQFRIDGWTALVLHRD
tara:strand:- start:2593 stop:3486 length:894 start_codon:yes stop_codon:yes gene_type:complete